MEDILVIIFVASVVYAILQTLKYIILPKLVVKSMKEIEKNPKWIMSKANYYGFQDIDIILAESKLGGLPCSRLTKDNRFQLLIPNDTLTKDAEEVVRLALVGKIYMKHNLFFPDKPTHWLSILCYMLDGGDINEVATSWEKKV